jgi:hypothetical protein
MTTSSWQANAGAVNIARAGARKDLAGLAERMAASGTKYADAGTATPLPKKTVRRSSAGWWAKLGMNDHNFFVMSARDDPIRGAGILAPLHGWGSDPNEIMAGVPERYRFTHLQTDAGWVNVAHATSSSVGSRTPSKR